MQPREWSAEDVETLHDLADAAVAELEGRAARILAEQALAREAHTAATLQHALLPGALPEMAGRADRGALRAGREPDRR